MNGIPTTYAGIEFRSRNEARWAVFFDLLGWRWEYEPFDGNGYIPDFVLIGDRPVVVEVKPDVRIADLHQYAKEVVAGLEGRWEHDVLIVGSTPAPAPDAGDRYWDGVPIGLLLEYLGWFETHDDENNFDDSSAGRWGRCSECNRPTFTHPYQSFRARVCGHYDGSTPPDISPSFVRDLWSQACNAVKWRPA